MNKARLLSILSLILVLIMLFTSCADPVPPSCEHADGTGDGLCDICGNEYEEPDDTPSGGDDTPSGGDDTPSGGGDTPSGGDNPSGGDTTDPEQGDPGDGILGDNTPSDAATPAINYTPLSSVPEYDGEYYTVLNNNVPTFVLADMTVKSYEHYGALDSLGRCTIAVACVGRDMLPTVSRGDISSVTPTGWKQSTYDSEVVPGGYIWNRSHLIAWSLTGEDANEKNLITGTPYLNQSGMRPFENMIVDYVKETGNHVIYRVVPVFVGNNHVASGLHMEAYSVEDDGDAICFNVFMHNVQPGIVIDYATGFTHMEGQTDDPYADIINNNPYGVEYVLNTNSKVIHLPTCSSASKMSASNRATTTTPIAELTNDGYRTCGTCKPHQQTEPLSSLTSYVKVVAYLPQKQKATAPYYTAA